MKRILLITHGSAGDRTSWSGLPYSLMKELKKYYVVDNYVMNLKASVLAVLRTIYYRKILRQFVSVRWLRNYAEAESANIDKILAKTKYDAVFAGDPGAASAIAYIKGNVPVIYYTDCIQSDLFDYYFFNVPEKLKPEIKMTQGLGIERSEKVIVTSSWAREGAVREYGTSPEKISVIPVGANVEGREYPAKEHQGINLLFVGVDWERKGADIAVECVDCLNQMDPYRGGYHLHLAGCKPPHEVSSKNVTMYGFLNRNIPEQREKLDELRAISDIFILPTRAECAGIVFCEACAYGLPSITYDTGGIASYIVNGKNGWRLPMGSDGEAFARKILELLSKPETLGAMKRNARRMYEEELNWEIAGRRMKEVIDEAMG